MRNLLDIIKRASTTNKGITFIHEENHSNYLPYKDLYGKARRYLFILQKNGIKPGDELVFQLESIEDFIYLFWACILGGIIPVPLSAGGNEEHRLKIIRVWQLLSSPYLVSTTSTFKGLKKHLENLCEAAKTVEDIEKRSIFLDKEVLGDEQGHIYHGPPGNIALIQFSSGSTGTPKGVTLTHANLLSNIQAIAEGIQCTKDDSSLSWMPLTHDMGLIGFHLSPVYACINQYILPTALFIRRPALWMDKTEEYKATILSSPNFGYKYFLDYLNKKDNIKYDLSCVRIIFNGAEPIDPNICDTFIERLIPFGLKKNVMFCVYGLAEASLAVTFPPLGEQVVTYRLNRNCLNIGDTVEYLKHNEPGALFVDLGYPVMDCSVGIFNEVHEIQKEGIVGYVHIKGNNVTRGYYHDEDATQKLINQDGWLTTGDIGFMQNGRLVITGRAKDILFVNGQNFYAHDMERQLYQLEEFELGAIAVCGVYNHAKQMEQICVFVVFKKSIPLFAPLALKIKTTLNKLFGLDNVHVIPVKRLPKTTSGKVQRYQLSQSFINGEFIQTIQELEEYIRQENNSRIIENPSNEVEHQLARMWKEVLQLQVVGVNEDFFKLGGNSLKAALLLNKIQEELNIEIGIASFFEASTIKDLANLLMKSQKIHYTKIKTIDKINKKEYYPVSSAQKRLYLLNQMNQAGHPDSLHSLSCCLGQTAYNMPYFMTVEGVLDINRLKNAFQSMANRHEALRTSFHIVEGQPVQKIHEDIQLDVVCHCSDIQNVDSLAADFIKPFDLAQAPLLRIELVKLNDTRHLLMFDMHHIISDGTTMGILIKEFTALYQGNTLPPAQIHYKDYAVWEQEYLICEQVQKQKQYWNERFSDKIPALALPADYPRPGRLSFEGERTRFTLSNEVKHKIIQLSEQTHTTPYMVLLAVYNILLSRYTGQQDIIVGSPILGRPRSELQGVMGMFVNSLAMRNHPEGTLTFKEFLGSIRKNCLEAFKNQNYPYESLIEDLNIPTGPARNPLFDTMFSMQNMELGEINLEGLKFTPYPYETGISKFDLTLLAQETIEGLEFELEYRTTLFKRETIQRMVNHFCNILREILHNPDRKLSNINIISDDEREQLLNRFNRSKTDFPKGEPLSLLFEHQAKISAQNTAVVFGNASLTYHELNVRANQLARILRKKGVAQNTIVGLLVEGSIEMIICILGILKAGGCYLPMDTANPKERIQGILEDSKAGLLIVQEELRDLTAAKACTLEEILFQAQKEDGENLDCINTSDNPAYIMYTSGSTGKPKGILTTHYNISRVVKNTNYISITTHDTMLQLSNYAFDGSTFDIFGSLLNGAKLILVSKNKVLDMNGLARLIEDEKVSLFFITTALFNALVDTNLDSLKNVRKILFGGERVSVHHVEKAFKFLGKGRLVHVYGPTESTVFATYHDISEIDKAAAIPIGKPVSNTTLYVVDSDHNLQPVDIPGELCISGDGLALGYLNRPELTAEKFVPNPYTSELMYKTGDLVKWLPDGNIEFLDRLDNQVKLRGFRIELGEIESAILHLGGFKEAFVTLMDQPCGKSLCAYIVSTKPIENDDFLCTVKNKLSEKLPDFMVPDYFIMMEKLPLTANGKVDKSRLPKIEDAVAMSSVQKYIPPETVTQQKLQAIWTDVLGMEDIGIDRKFSDIGGQSLKAAVIISRIYKEFHRNIPLKTFFQAQTIQKVAEFIDKSEEKEYESIPKAEKRNNYPLTFAQKGLLIQEQFEGIGTSYNMPVALEIEGLFDMDCAVHCFKSVVHQHEPLRTCFETVDGTPVQKISEDIHFDVMLCEGSYEDKDTIIKHFVRPFSLDTPPLFRVQIVKFSDSKHMLLIDMHHIISDGISLAAVIRHFARLYNIMAATLADPGSIRKSEASHPHPNQLQYTDFAVWQHNFLLSEKAKELEAYWWNVLTPDIPVLNMPYDYQRIDKRTFDGRSHLFSIDEKTGCSLKKMASESNLTLHSIFMSVYSVMLSRYSAQKDLMIGSLVSGRYHPDVLDMIGMFNNFLPIRIAVNPGSKFTEFAHKTTGNLFTAYENQEYPYHLMVEKFGSHTPKSRNPFFDTMLIYHNQLENDFSIEMDGLEVKRYPFPSNTSKLDFKLDIYHAGDNGLNCIIEYNTNLFAPDTISKMSRHFMNILDAVLSNPGILLKEIDMLSKEEKNQIIHEFNDTFADYPKLATINQLFTRQAAKTPDRMAASFGNKRLTYHELNTKANRLARTLITKGAERETIIALLVERSLDMTIGLMGILKSGAAYLPISPDYPADRIQYMLEDSGAILLLTQERFMDRLAEHNIIAKENIINLEDTGSYHPDGSEVDANHTSENLAYVIYTSGSTGKPKGAMIQHGSLVNRLNWMQKIYPIGEGDVILQKTPYTFDVSVWEQFWWAIQGASVCFLEPGGEKDPEAIVTAIEKNQITTIHFVPSMLHLFLEYIDTQNQPDRLKSLKQVFASGEALIPTQVKRFNNLLYCQNGTKLHNLYGPTEATIDVSYFDCSNELDLESIPIGKPIDNINLYIVDKNNHLCPVGVPGELCIAGEGLARGYLNRPQLTAEKFVPNPFKDDKPLTRHYTWMYKTGDLAKWRQDGNIEYLGRLDFQVKIRGNRIELGEIESALSKHPDIKEAIVLAKDHEDGSKYLCSYYAGDKELAPAELRSFLSRCLAEYMIPSYFIKLEKIPLSSNGKVDRKALPEPDAASIKTGIEYRPPETITQKKLETIWEEILGLSNIGIDDDFFDLGGHSLKAGALVPRIHKEFGAPVNLRDIFNFTTIRELSEHIQTLTPKEFEGIKPALKKDYYPLSSAQKRLYILSRIEDGGTAYNLPGAMLIQGILDLDKFTSALRKLVTRHETLRTSFQMVDGQPVQVVHPSMDFDIQVLESNQSAVSQLLKEFVKPFDISKAPLIRMQLVQVSETMHVFMFDMHHIISDGLSSVILVKDFVDLYKGQEPPGLKITYKDYSEWQNDLFQSGKLIEQENYWLRTLSDDIPVLNMPTDYPRPSAQSFEGNKLTVAIPDHVVEKINQLANSTGTTRFMVMLAAYHVLLSKYSGQNDIIVGCPTAGRQHHDLENLIGMFVNTVAIRSKPAAKKSFNQFLDEVRENSLNAFENQAYPLEELIDKLQLPKDLSRNPLFDTLFVLQNMTIPDIEVEELQFTSYPLQNNVSKVDMTLEVVESEAGLKLNLEYCTALFKPETILLLAGHYIGILDRVSTNPEQCIKDIDMLSKEEKNKIIHEFNDTFAEYPREATINQLFTRQAAKTPTRLAASYGNERLTYRELNTKANRLARTLSGKGAERETIVALLVERSLEMTIGLMGILKSGAAYLPISPDYPADRIQFMLEDSGAILLLTQERFMDRLAAQNIIAKENIINLEDANFYHSDGSDMDANNTSENLAYVIYTSGSTGKPKGAMIQHGSLVNRLNWMQKMYPIDEGDVILQKTPYTFDVSVWEQFWWAIQGASVCFLEPGGEKDPEAIVTAIEKNQITTLHFVPSMLHLFLEYIDTRVKPDRLKSLKQVFASGEALGPTLVKRFNNLLYCQNGTKLHNLYGPTEATIDVSYFDCSKELDLDVIPIGKPINNINLYIVDKNNHLCPVGVPGELCIAGEGLARRYLNRPQLTTEKFVFNPFKDAKPSTRHYTLMYKTGDLAKWRQDGNIEYLGRLDFQVKIQGNRIELGEIESALSRHPEIKEAVVLAKDHKDGSKYLCSYYAGDKELSPAELRSFLSTSLAEYMIPSYFIKLEKIPLSLNGKVDRKALPEPDSASIKTGIEYRPAETITQKKLEAIWKEILGLPGIGMDDNFFDLGGNSLLLIRMHSKLEEEFPGRTKVTDLFSNPSIAKLAQFMDSMNESQEEFYVKTLLPEDYFKTESGIEEGASSFHYTFRQNLYDNIKNIEGCSDLKPEHVLVSLFVHLLHQVSKQSSIRLHVGHEDSISPIEVSLDGVKQLSDLVIRVRDSMEVNHFKFDNASRKNSPGTNRIDIGSTNNEVMVFISTHPGISNNSSLLSIFDLMVNISQLHAHPLMDVDFNNRRLKPAKVKELIENYIKFINIAAG